MTTGAGARTVMTAADADHLLESPLRLRLLAVLLEAGDTPVTMEQAVVQSGRHEQDVLGCLRPVAKAGIIEEIAGGPGEPPAFRINPGQPPEQVEALRQGIQRRADALGRERHVRERVLAGMIGVNPKMQIVFELIRQVSRIDVPVLIQGETGTGKEMVARAIHDLGRRRSKLFGAVNSATLSETLFESQLFGHVRGAFTSAVRDQAGLIERCDGGTLFLDEMGELSLANQAKLLRVLQERSFSRVGETAVRRSDFRLIAATNRDLQAMVKQGTFREDLFYRINVFPVRLPSLRERLDDLPHLVAEILAANARRAGLVGDRPPPVLPDALEAMRGYSWPGNVRELENVVIRAAVAAGGSPIAAEHLPALTAPAAESPRESTPPAPALKSLAEVEKDHIGFVLGVQKGNLQATAKVLGISRTTLYKKIRQYGLI
jgi:transcriptional regulator with PAS, ATPase and Fis domain